MLYPPHQAVGGLREALFYGVLGVPEYQCGVSDGLGRRRQENRVVQSLEEKLNAPVMDFLG